MITRRLFRQALTPALALLFPLQCVGCRRWGQIICPTCRAGLSRLHAPFCPICAQPGVPASSTCRACAASPLMVDGIQAPFLMQGATREAIYALKYRGLRAAATELGALLARHLAEHPVPGDVLAPVPLHSRRMRQRGYNQAALLAREVSRYTGLTYAEGLLARRRDTPPQVQTASRDQRRANVADSFVATGDVRGLAVVLVDDVTTTGSTFSAAAAALKSAGASSVWGLALAKEA
jgi:ComF family protein